MACKRLVGLFGIVIVMLWSGAARAAAAGADAPPRCADVARRPNSDSWRPARTTLLPPGATRVRLCAYRSRRLGGTQRLTQQAALGMTRTRDVTRTVDALDRAPKQTGYQACFGDDNPITLDAWYSPRRVVQVYIRTTNCFFATNGVHSVTPRGPLIGKALDLLKSLLSPIPRLANISALGGDSSLTDTWAACK